MGKNEKTGLGRALVKHHNQMLQQSNEKGRFYKNQHKKVLESITDVNDIDAVIQEADEAQRLFAFDHPAPNVLINLYVYLLFSIFVWENHKVVIVSREFVSFINKLVFFIVCTWVIWTTSHLNQLIWSNLDAICLPDFQNW